MENSTRNDRVTARSKSPLELAKLALESAREAIPQYSSRFSRHDYTQYQLYALVALRRLLRTDYRGLEATLRDWTELREALGLTRVPDHSTIQRAERRLKARPRRRARAARSHAESLPLFDQQTDQPPAPLAGNAA
jgi:hypothetical protein